MKRWTYIGENSEDRRWQTLSSWLNQRGCANEYVPFSGDGAHPAEFSELAEFDHVRLSTRVGPQTLRTMNVQSSWVTLLGVVDGMNNTPAGWWSLCALYEAFGQLLIELGQEMDMRGSVLVAGVGGAARTAIAAFFKAGFNRFLIVNVDTDEAQDMIREMKAKFFGLTLEFVPKEKIVLLPGESSVFVNTTPTFRENELLLELSYMNFLKRPGHLFDLNKGDRPSVLVQEAIDAGVNIISGVEIAARCDCLWAKWAFQTELPLEDYRNALAKSLVAEE